MAGFDGRVFLTDEEHGTYLRRMPVRYIKHKKAGVCCVCGLPALPDKPLENAHRIPFNSGVKVYKLTPDYLDEQHNIVTAHRGACNASCELGDAEIRELLDKLRS